MLKGIDGPMTDIQIEDLSIIHRDTQFALELVQDYRARFIQPVLVPPVPVALDDLLALGEDDLPLGRIATQKLTIKVEGGAYHSPYPHIPSHISPLLLLPTSASSPS